MQCNRTDRWQFVDWRVCIASMAFQPHFICTWYKSLLNRTNFHSIYVCLFYLYFAERLNVLYERNWTMLVHEQLRRFEGSIIKATKGGLSEAMGERLPRWTFTEALLYSITLITTIGNFKLSHIIQYILLGSRFGFSLLLLSLFAH